MLKPLGRRVVRRIASAPPFAVLAAAWVYLIVYAFPGIMTQDSYDHLREARDRVYSDGHPPAINLLWKLTDMIVAGPFGMLVIQVTCIVAALYLVMRRVFEPRPAAWVAAAVFLWPPVLVPFAVIWKDPLMAGFLMLGFVGLLSAHRRYRLLGLLGMVAAVAVRYNAIAATLPLVVLLFEWTPGLHWLKRYAISVVAWLAVTFASFQLNAALTDHRLHLWHSIAVFDIVGTLAHLDEDLSDAELETLFAGSDLLVHQNIHATARELYTPRDFLPITNHPTKTMWALPINGYVPPPEAQRDAITRAWEETLATWPWAYTQHRFAVFAECIGLGKSKASGAIPKRAYYKEELPRSMGLSTRESMIQGKLTRAYLYLSRTVMFRVWLYLLVALALLPFAIRQRDTLALLLSGLGLEASLVVLAPSPDYRYSHWLVMCAVIAGILVGVRRRRAKMTKAPP